MAEGYPSSRLPWIALLLACAGAFALAFIGWLRSRERDSLRVLWPAPEFRLTERSGRTVTTSSLRGRVWVVDFVFTRCTTICWRMHSRFFILQEEIPGLTLCSVSVDPEYDTPEVLRAHATKYDFDKPNWLWLTGDKKSIYDMMERDFKVVRPRPDQGDQVMHSEQMVLVDGRGRVRGVYAVLEDDPAFETLKRDARTLIEAEKALAPVRRLPTVNAVLNGTSALLLICGFLFIRRRRVGAHKACMISATVSSALFLACYLTYHNVVGSVPFEGTGWIRPVYFAILISHTVLAALIVPMVLATLFNAVRARFDSHRAIARWTLPLWLYVSITGVVVYTLLYVLYPGGR